MKFTAFKTGFKKYFTPVYIIVVLALMGWFFYKTRDSLGIYLQNFKGGYLVAGAALLASYYFFQCLGFITIQSHTARIEARKINLIDWLYGYLYGLIGHYIPGKISVVLGRIMVLQPFGISAEAAGLSVLYETIISTIITIAMGLPLLFVTNVVLFHTLWSQLTIVVLFLVAVVLFFFTPLFQKSIFVLLRLFRITPPDKNIFLDLKTLLNTSFRYLISFIILIFTFYMFCKSITDLNFDMKTIYIVGAGMVFSGGIGVIALFAPSGLGVREAGIVYFMSVATNLIPLEVALLIAVCFRILTAIVEILAFGLSACLYKHKARQHKNQ